MEEEDITRRVDNIVRYSFREKFGEYQIIDNGDSNRQMAIAETENDAIRIVDALNDYDPEKIAWNKTAKRGKSK